MGSQVYRETYLAALEVAHSNLDRVNVEFENLQLRKEQLEYVLGALESFLRSAKPASRELRQPEPVHAEPIITKSEPEIAQPALRAVPVSEPVTPAAFSP